jgi:iron-sulfur cluster assembly protein
LRIGVKKGGCAGMEYTMDYASEVDPMDEVVEQDGARVMIAPMAQMFLFGTEIDYETSLLESGFKFRNPNVEDACGCGESIKFKDVEELAADLENASKA